MDELYSRSTTTTHDEATTTQGGRGINTKRNGPTGYSCQVPDGARRRSPFNKVGKRRLKRDLNTLVSIT
jgi:hypothetical protein